MFKRCFSTGGGESAAVNRRRKIVEWEYRGEQVRSDAAEKKYNGWWLLAVVGVPLLMGAAAAAWMIGMSDRLPEPMATHWNSNSAVDGFATLGTTVAMTVLLGGGFGTLLGVVGIASRGQSIVVARVLVAAGFGGGIAMVSLFVDLVTGQVDLADSSQAALGSPVLGMGLGLGVAVAVVAFVLYKPGAVSRIQEPNTLALNAEVTRSGSLLQRQGVEAAARGETLRINVSLGAWQWALSLGVGAVVAVSTGVIFSGLAALGLPVAALIWIFCHGTVVIGPDGVKVLAAGLWRIMPLSYREIKGATVKDIMAMDYGGWGYRMTGGDIGFIMTSGPAVVLQAGSHQNYVLSMLAVPAAGEAAALINAYAQAARVEN